MLKIIAVYVLRFLLSFLKLFRIRENRIFFESFQGEQYSCNPKYIYLTLLRDGKDYDFVWSLYDSSMLTDGRSKIVKHRSLKYFYYYITAKYVFTNCDLPYVIPKKKGSIWINTWHGGGAYKKLFINNDNFNNYQKELMARNTDYYISSNSKFTEVMSEYTGISQSNFLQTGMPRNDVLFCSDEMKNNISSEIRNYYKIPLDAFIVLYAPTYRGKASDGNFDFSLDFNECKKAFEIRFKKKIYFLVRTHPAINENFHGEKNCINAKAYPDTQELIIASDALITDYSSILWDFCLTKKPGFLFTPDVEKYQSERGFYTDISEWAYPYARKNEDLCQLIMNYNSEESERKINVHLENLVSFENGTACKQIIDKIIRGII